MEALTDKEFLELLAQRDIRVSARNAKLHVDAPAGALTESLRAEFLRRKSSLLSFLSASADDRYTIVARHTDRVPLTAAQERIWIIEQFNPGTAAYNIPEAFVLDRHVDENRFRAAASLLLHRHKVLSSFIFENNGRLELHYSPDAKVPIAFHDVSSLTSGEQPEQLISAIQASAKAPFNLHSAPLLRFDIYQAPDSKSVVLLNVHHIVSDRWSLNILWRELIHLYSGDTVELPQLSIQFSDYALWEKEFLSTPYIQSQIDYWKTQLDGVPPLLELPFSKPRPSVPSLDGDTYSFSLSKDRLAELTALARSENTSLFILLFAVFSVMLYRYTDQPDFCLGSPISGRNWLETEPLIGLFVNTILLRCKLNREATFRQHLQAMRRTALDAYDNKDVPFQRLVTELNPERGDGISPFFQIMFAFETVENSKTIFGEQIDAHPGISKLDLTLQLTEHSNGISGIFEYRTDLFESEDIRKLAEHFEVLIESVTSDPDAQIGKLGILSPAERKAILSEWNRTEAAFPTYNALHYLFEEQVSRTPGAPAVLFGADAFSYKEINEKANRLAHYLIEGGVIWETCVGVYLDRTPDIIVTILAVLKAGGAYVALDPAYPESRLSFIAEDSGLRLCITKSTLRPKIKHSALKLIYLDLDADTIDRMPIDNPGIAVARNNAAYIIYTSGSTGNPKGVVVEHRNAVAFLQWAHSVFPSETVLASTSLCFDLSIFEIFGPLGSGNAIVLADDVLQLHELHFKNRVTLINSVPSAMATLLKSGPLPPTIRTVNLAGEFLPSSLVRAIYNSSHVRHVYDLYGPSETTTYSTFALRSVNEVSATIGRPIANTRVYILDADLQPVPPTVRGELYIAGDGVTRGYLNRSQLTRERFVSLQHLGENTFVYRTGDIARYRHNGEIEYVGRSDNQVKLRGYRIELGEIESAMRRFTEVRDAATLVLHDTHSGDRLIGYVTTDNPDAFSKQELIAFLRVNLPPYMVVTDVTALQQFPTTANGKIDRKALLSLYIPQHKQIVERRPTNEIEKQVANIWEHCFQRRPIGIDDNFFEIGGHSLLAFEVFAMIEKTMGKQMMLATLLQSPTIATLSDAISRQGGIFPSSIRSIRLNGNRAAVFAMQPGIAQSECYKNLAHRLHAERPFYLVVTDQTPIQLDEDIARFQPDAPYILLGYGDTSNLAYSAAVALSAQSLPVSLILIEPSLAKLSVDAANEPEGTSSLRRFYHSIKGKKSDRPTAPIEGRTLVIASAEYEATEQDNLWIQRHKDATTRYLPCPVGKSLSEPYVMQTAELIEKFLEGMQACID